MKRLVQLTLIIGWNLLATIGTANESPRRIWIDTDAACGISKLKDVDDCLAIALLLSNPSWEVVGISSVFGNASVQQTDLTIRRLLDSWCGGCVSVYRGAAKPGSQATPASSALADALILEPLTVFILGPASNIETAIRNLAEPLHKHQFVAVAGTRQLRERFGVSRFSPFRFRDLNFAKDPDAFAYLLDRGVNLTLMPYELAQQVTLGQHHMETVSSRFPELATHARTWMWVWRMVFGKNGFHPFDAVAVSILFGEQAELVCSRALATSVTLERNSNSRREQPKILYVVVDGDITNVTYCHSISQNYADHLIYQLAGKDGRSIDPNEGR